MSLTGPVGADDKPSAGKASVGGDAASPDVAPLGRVVSVSSGAWLVSSGWSAMDRLSGEIGLVSASLDSVPADIAVSVSERLPCSARPFWASIFGPWLVLASSFVPDLG